MNYSKENNPVQILVYSTGIIYEKEFLHYCSLNEFEGVKFNQSDYTFLRRSYSLGRDLSVTSWEDYKELFNRFKKMEIIEMNLFDQNYIINFDNAQITCKWVNADWGVLHCPTEIGFYDMVLRLSIFGLTNCKYELYRYKTIFKEYKKWKLLR